MPKGFGSVGRITETLKPRKAVPMMTSNRVTTVGIMFEGHDDDPFPRLSDVGCDWTGLFDLPDEMSDWFVVASNPNRVTYFDDDSEAMDTTNWDAIVGGLADLPEIDLTGQNIDGRYVYDFDDDEIERAVDLGYAIVGKVLCIAPDSEEVDEMVGYRTALQNYPLLDEDAYSELESAAWDAFLADGLKWDATRDLAEMGIDDDTVESIDDAWDWVGSAACEHLHYYNGFSGEHGPGITECIGKAVSRQLCVLLLGRPADEPYFGFGY